MNLTPRQCEMLDLLVLGLTNAEIGQNMRPPITGQTVKDMLTNVAFRLGLTGCNRVEIAVLWVRRS